MLQNYLQSYIIKLKKKTFLPQSLSQNNFNQI